MTSVVPLPASGTDFLVLKRRLARTDEMLDTERKTCAIERGSDDGEHDERAVISGSIIDCGSVPTALGAARIPTAISAKRVANAIARREAESAASRGTSAGAGHGEGRDAARTNRH
jgi:hypothetical protein